MAGAATLILFMRRPRSLWAIAALCCCVILLSFRFFWRSPLAGKGRKPPLAKGLTRTAVLEYCLDDLNDQGPDNDAIVECFEALAGLASTRNLYDDLCWPSQRPAGNPRRFADSEILSISPQNCSRLPVESLFHTVALGHSPPPVFGPFLAAFLATQCCTAELWVWTTQQRMTREGIFRDYSIPSQHQHRIRVLPFDALTQWRAIEGEEVFKKALDGRSGVDLLIGDYWDKVDASNQADVARMLVMHRYGGTYLDMDVLALQDLRPLLGLRDAMTYRWSCHSIVNTAISNWGSCGSGVSTEIISAVLEGMTAGTAPRSAYYNHIAYATLQNLMRLPSWRETIGVAPSMLLDPLWTRSDDCEPRALNKYNPDIHDINAAYERRDIGPVGSDEQFFAGVPFAHHVHNADAPSRSGGTPGTWGAELLRRHRALLESKQC